MSSLTHRHPTTTVASVALGLLVASLLGCGEEEIRTYAVDKPVTPADRSDSPTTTTPPTTPPTNPHAPVAGGSHRMIGAIAPANGRTWYLKMLGKAEPVEAHAKAFDAMLSGMEFTDDADEPVKFKTVPDGWVRKPGGGMRYATFAIGEYDPALELSVIPLGGTSGSLRDNIDRWRSQVGLKAATDKDLEDTTRTVMVGDTKVTVIDMTGPGLSNNIPGRNTGATPPPTIPPFLARPPEQAPTTPEGPATPAASDDPITVKLPEGWSKIEKLPPMATMAFVVDQGDTKLVTTVTKLGGAAGGVEANVARWARQINGKAKTSETEVDGQPATYAFVAGPTDMILGIITKRGDSSWFVKLRGPIDPVAAQKANFDALVQSIKFNEGE